MRATAVHGDVRAPGSPCGPTCRLIAQRDDVTMGTGMPLVGLSTESICTDCETFLLLFPESGREGNAFTHETHPPGTELPHGHYWWRLPHRPTPSAS